MAEMTLHVTIRHIPVENFSDDSYDKMIDFIVDALDDIAEQIGGEVYDTEIK